MDVPWNAQQVFDPVPFAQRWEIEGTEPIAPEKIPVKTIHPNLQAATLWERHALAVQADMRSHTYRSPQPISFNCITALLHFARQQYSLLQQQQA